MASAATSPSAVWQRRCGRIAIIWFVVTPLACCGGSPTATAATWTPTSTSTLLLLLLLLVVSTAPASALTSAGTGTWASSTFAAWPPSAGPISTAADRWSLPFISLVSFFSSRRLWSPRTILIPGLCGFIVRFPDVTAFVAGRCGSIF